MNRPIGFLNPHLINLLAHTVPRNVVQIEHVGPSTRLYVFGDPENATYEWAIVDAHGNVQSYSNKGYGDSTIALRDGLIEALGLPEGGTQ
jgi:hypothetical protein